MRGAHHYNIKVPAKRVGSPPHARGPLSHAALSQVITGITPACAGPTLQKCGPGERAQDHPRMRGAHR